MTKHFKINFCNAEKISKKEADALLNSDRDYITWYDDGDNIFIGVCYLSQAEVIRQIKHKIGNYKTNFDMSF